MSTITDITDQTACPACGGGRIACVMGREFDVCISCHKLWERIEPGYAFKRDDELMAFDLPCGNCAFRGGSPERADPPRWAELQETLAEGAEFYCHKGVPLSATIEEIVDDLPGCRMQFDFPQETKTVELEGKTHTYQSFLRGEMRMCRGWLNAYVRPLFKEVKRDAQ